MYKYGIRGLPLTWFTSYLSERKQYVKISNSESSLQNIKCGVPQGSTLGPLLFLLYINDLPNSSNKLTFRIFADDTNIFYSSQSLQELETIVNNELTKVIEYCAVNKLSINFKKTSYMLITSPRKRANISITACNIELKTYMKYLGVYIDNHLQWSPQITHVNNKLAKSIGILRKLRYYVSLNTLKNLYYTLVYPYLNYGLMSWGTASQTRLKSIRSNQNKCVRSFFFARKRENASPFYKLLDILKIENVFKLKISLTVHKSKSETEFFPQFFSKLIPFASTIHNYNTRYSKNDNLFRPASRTNYGLTRFRAIASRIWEDIPTKLKSLSHKSFKKQYKHYFRFFITQSTVSFYSLSSFFISS